MLKYTNTTFADKSNNTHDFRYDYSLVVYINNKRKVKIVCPIHGVFEQTPNNHLSGHGCPGCFGTMLLTTEKFISKSNIKHNHFYNYEFVKYINNHICVKIKCPIHGIFEQTPNRHLNGGKCPKCNIKTKNIEYLTENLTIEEEPIEVDGKVQCRCGYCKKYFKPTVQQLLNRIKSLFGKLKGESRLYCSDECKNLCPIFGKSLYPKGFKVYRNISRSDQAELRLLTLERDNFTCQRCDSTEDLVCHHITGIEINPVESADVDNCIILCYTCHNKVHSENGCSMQRQPCMV